MERLQTPKGESQHLFLPKDLIRFSFPYRPTASTQWCRLNGDDEYSVIAGRIVDAHTGQLKTLIPSGKIARLLLLWICTQAKLQRSKTVAIKPTMRSFLAQLGVPWNKRNACEVANQLQALIACKLQVTTCKAGEGKIIEIRNLLFADEAHLWFVNQDQTPKQESFITLSQLLYDELTEAVPLNKAAIDYLCQTSKSALALDVYCWLCLRLYVKAKPSRVSWNQLHTQFGSQNDLKRFKPTFREALEKARHAYPDSRIVETGETCGRGTKGFVGYLLYPSPDPRKQTVGE